MPRVSARAKYIIAIIFITIIAYLTYFSAAKRNEEISGSPYMSEGVVVCGYNSNGWIENTNSFPVRIEKVIISQQYYSEATISITRLEPYEKMESYIGQSHGFYIYTLDGIEIGWISPSPES